MKQKTKLKKRNEKAFTLIEVMFGVAIFAIALFGVMMTLGYSLTMSTFADNRAIAMNKAQRVIEELRRVADINGLAALPATANNNWTTFTNPNLNNTTSTLDSENITVTAPNGWAVDPVSIRVLVTWNEKGKNTVYAVDTMVTDR